MKLYKLYGHSFVLEKVSYISRIMPSDLNRSVDVQIKDMSKIWGIELIIDSNRQGIWNDDIYYKDFESDYKELLQKWNDANKE